MLDFMTSTVIPSVLIGTVAIAASALAYRRAPFRTHRPAKPSFVFFPKYEAAFGCSSDALRQALLSLGFKPGDPKKDTIDRGKWYGDFSLKLAWLRAEVDAERQRLRLYAPFLIFFDTGDTWQLTQEIVSAANDRIASQ